MPSLQSQVTEELKNDNNLTLSDTYALFSDHSPDYIKVCYYRAKKNRTKTDTRDTKHISMEQMEKLIMQRLKHKPTLPELKLAVDFLKIKQQDHSELEEIDLEQFYKKAMMD